MLSSIDDVLYVPIIVENVHLNVTLVLWLMLESNFNWIYLWEPPPQKKKKKKEKKNTCIKLQSFGLYLVGHPSIGVRYNNLSDCALNISNTGRDF